MDADNLRGKRSFLAEIEPYFERNDFQTVLDIARDRMKKIPDDLDSRIAVCRVWLLQGRIDEARDMLLEIEDIIAGLSRLYSCMGDLYKKKGMEGEAEIFYRKFKALNPVIPPGHDLDARFENVGAAVESVDTEIVNAEGGKDEEETDGDEESPRVSPGFETATLAELYMRQGHTRMAEEILEKIVGRDPQNARARELLDNLRGTGGGETPIEINEKVVSELLRWLDNIDRRARHAE